MNYFTHLQGNLCYLSPVNPEDAPQYTKWLNDLSLTINLTLAHKLISLPKEKEILETMASEGYNWSIIGRGLAGESDQLLGSCGLMEVDQLNGTAEYGIFIGSQERRGKGIGTEATQLVLSYAFSVMNLYNILLRVYSFNKQGIRCYEKAGFRRIGVRKGSKLLGGKRYDTVLMEAVSEGYPSQQLFQDPE